MGLHVLTERLLKGDSWESSPLKEGESSLSFADLTIRDWLREKANFLSRVIEPFDTYECYKKLYDWLDLEEEKKIETKFVEVFKQEHGIGNTHNIIFKTTLIQDLVEVAKEHYKEEEEKEKRIKIREIELKKFREKEAEGNK